MTLAEWIVNLLVAGRSTRPETAGDDPATVVVRDEVERRLRSQPLGEAVLQALAAEPDNQGRRLQVQVEVANLLAADPHLAEWAERHTRSHRGQSGSAATARRSPVTVKNRRTAIGLAIVVGLILGVIMIVVLATSGNDVVLAGQWEEIADSISREGEVLLHSNGESRSILTPLVIYEDGQLSSQRCRGTVESVADDHWRLTFDCGVARMICDASMLEDVKVKTYRGNEPVIVGTVSRALQVRCPNGKRYVYVRPGTKPRTVRS